MARNRTGHKQRIHDLIIQGKRDEAIDASLEDLYRRYSIDPRLPDEERAPKKDRPSRTSR